MPPKVPQTVANSLSCDGSNGNTHTLCGVHVKHWAMGIGSALNSGMTVTKIPKDHALRQAALRRAVQYGDPTTG